MRGSTEYDWRKKKNEIRWRVRKPKSILSNGMRRPENGNDATSSAINIWPNFTYIFVFYHSQSTKIHY